MTTKRRITSVEEAVASGCSAPSSDAGERGKQYFMNSSNSPTMALWFSKNYKITKLI
jgi:hypothetical protein